MDYEEDKKNMICLEEKSSLPSIRGGIKGEVIALLKSFSYLGFKRKKDSTSPLTPLLKEERGRKVAFTLAETLIVLTVLGIVAAITIPPVVRQQIEAANRAKLKKVMTVYDFFINKVSTENDIKNTKALKDWGEEGGICENQRKYFKPVKIEDAGCKFKTADGVWWDVTDITHPVVALKKGELDNPDSKTTFKLLAHFGPNGELRVSDIQWELANNESLTQEEKEELEKLYAYINNEKTKKDTSIFASCNNTYPCEVTYACPTTDDPNKTCTAKESKPVIFDEDYTYDGSNCMIDTSTCNELKTNSKAISGTYMTANIGANISWDDADSECKKLGSNYRVATTAELQKLKSTGNLKCYDGSSNCDFMTSEKSFAVHVNSSSSYVVSFSSYNGYVYDSQIYDNKQVLCVGK